MVLEMLVKAKALYVVMVRQFWCPRDKRELNHESFLLSLSGREFKKATATYPNKIQATKSSLQYPVSFSMNEVCQSVDPMMICAHNFFRHPIQRRNHQPTRCPFTVFRHLSSGLRLDSRTCAATHRHTSVHHPIQGSISSTPGSWNST